MGFDNFPKSYQLNNKTQKPKLFSFGFHMSY